MNTRLYVGRLHFDAKERDLEEFFRQYGRLRDVVIKSGYAFVEFEDGRDAEDAVRRLDGRELLGERVHLEFVKRPPHGYDRERTAGTKYLSSRYGPSPPRYRDRGGNYGPRERDDGYQGRPMRTQWKVIVENLSSRISWKELKDIMNEAGDVAYTDAHNRVMHEGMVCYYNEKDFRRALDVMDGKEINGRKIRLVDGTKTRSLSRDKSSSRSRSPTPVRNRSRSRSRSKESSVSSRGDSRKKRGHSRSRSRSPRSHSRGSSSASSDRRQNKKRPRSQSHSPENRKKANGTGKTDAEGKKVKKGEADG